MDKNIENKIKEAVRKLLHKGRPGDWEHTLRAVTYGKRLLEAEGGDPRIVIPALYLHDTGWSKLDYTDFATSLPSKRSETYSGRQHMRYSAEIALKILKKLNYEELLLRRIVRIISIHDLPDRVSALNDISATLVMEADCLDRYGPGRLKRPIKFNWCEGKEENDYLREGIKKWFRTKTARQMVRELASDLIK